ncbi:MAG: hypothetical protein NTW30_06135 [Candidatus Aenigmarchaeota archaeon]|nr:hypothetical protein [Candidatus Aenigmarchaeota archaeon]
MKHLSSIYYETIKHKDQRYDTLGDYFKGDYCTEFYVSQCKNADYEFMILIHELTEWYLCQKRGIKNKDIDKFDMTHLELEDPGRSKEAPYHKEHMFAERIEKLICKELGIKWDNYYGKELNK